MMLNKKIMNKNSLFLTFCVFFTIVFMASSVGAEPDNLGLLKQSLIRYYDSGQYFKEIAAVTSQASDYIQKEAALNRQLSNPKHLAIVLDIDETSLSNYANMLKDDFANNTSKITQELLEAKEPPIAAVLDLYHQAVQSDIAVFFITGREPSLRDATIQNLRAAGYNQWSGLSFRSTKLPTIAYKTCERSKISALGYTIIASFGDQESDLKGGYAQQTFKLPNPFYYLP